MKLLTYITKGQAVIQGDSLRCAAPRDKNRICNKLIAKRNEQNQVAGNFKCERCSQEIEVKLAPAREDINSKVI